MFLSRRRTWCLGYAHSLVGDATRVDEDENGLVATVQLPNGQQVALPLAFWNQLRDSDHDEAMAILMAMVQANTGVQENNSDGESDDDD